MKHLMLYNKPLSNIRRPVRMTTKSLPITLKQHSFAYLIGTRATTIVNGYLQPGHSSKLDH